MTVVTPPEPVVTWEETQSALRLNGDEEQAYVEGLIAAATAWIDGPAGWLGICIGPQTLEARFDRFEDRTIRLPYGPVTDIVDVKYLDGDGAEQTLSPGAYVRLTGCRIWLKSDQSWPSVQDTPEAVRITYEAGHDEVPASITQAILLLVGHWYRSRQAVVVGESVANLPLGVEALLAPHRSWPS